MPVSHKLKTQIFMDVTHPRPLDAEGTGSTFSHTVCIYYTPQHIITQQTVHSTTLSVFTIHHSIQSYSRQFIPHMSVFNIHHSIPSHNRQYIPPKVCIYYPP